MNTKNKDDGFFENHSCIEIFFMIICFPVVLVYYTLEKLFTHVIAPLCQAIGECTCFICRKIGECLGIKVKIIF